MYFNRCRLLPTLSEFQRVIAQRIQFTGEHQRRWQSAQIAVKRRQWRLSAFIIAQSWSQQAQRLNHARAVEYQRFCRCGVYARVPARS